MQSIVTNSSEPPASTVAAVRFRIWTTATKGALLLYTTEYVLVVQVLGVFYIVRGMQPRCVSAEGRKLKAEGRG
jgi:hypothetical protein